MPGLNLERLKSLSEELREAIENLKEYLSFDTEEILNDKRMLQAIKYNFIVGIQSAIDICQHIVARKAGKVPDEYGECFLIMRDLGYLNGEYAIKAKKMAGFRNLLIHQYWLVDNRRVCAFLKDDLGIMEKFLEMTKKVVEGEVNEPNGEG